MEVIWTKEALQNLKDILDYVYDAFGKNSVDAINDTVWNFMDTISQYSEFYPLATQSINLRRAVIHKRLVVFYKISKHEIVIVSLSDTRRQHQRPSTE